MISIFANMECLKQRVKSKKVQNWLNLPSSFLDYDELEVIITPVAYDNIQDFDLSPIEFDYIDYDDKKLHFKNRLVLTPKLDDSGQLYIISYPPFNLETFADTRNEIIDGVKSDIVFIWNEYAKGEDSELTAGALELKKKLLSNIEEIVNA